VTTRVGLVGCGLIGFVHSFTLRLLTEHQLVDAAVTATFDPQPDRAQAFAAAHDDAVACPDLEALLDQVDAVWVCTWTAAHREAVEAAAARRLAIFCEKPLAPTLAECEAVAERLASVPHQVGLVLRTAPVFRALADAVHRGEHGAPLAVVFRDDQYFPNQGLYGSDWRADVTRAGAGTLLEHSIHDVDILRWLLGDPDHVRASLATRFGHPGIEDVAALTCTFPDGVVATLTSVWHQVLSRGSSRRVEVFCERALLWLDDDFTGPLHVETVDGTATTPCEPPSWVQALEAPPMLARAVAEYAPASKAFLDGLAAGGGTTPGPHADTALAAHRIVDAAYRSAAAGGEALAPSAR
jgi:predicted dehydrogenase